MKLSRIILFFALMLLPFSLYAQSVKAFVALDSNSEDQMRFALSYGEKFCKISSDIAFEVLVGGRAVTMFSKKKSPVIKESLELQKNCKSIKYVACKETVDKMEAAGGEHTPDFISGVNVTSCGKRVAELTEQGYFRIDAASGVGS